MKYALYIIGIVLFVAIAIIAFGNIGAACMDLAFFFTEISATFSVTIGIFVIAFIGMLTGAAFGAGFVMGGSSEDEEYEDEE